MGYMAVAGLKDQHQWFHLLFALYPRFEKMVEDYRTG